MGDVEPTVVSHPERFSYLSSKSPGRASVTPVLKLPGCMENKLMDLERKQAQKGMTVQQHSD